MTLLSRARRTLRALTQITQNIFTTPHQNWLDNNGVPLADGRLYVYAAGTQTPVNTWQDQALSIINTNPIVLDAGGFTTVWLQPTEFYKFRMVNRFGEQQWTIDNYQGGSLTANILVPLNFIIPAFAPNDINNGNNSQAWRWQLTGTVPADAFAITEPAPSTNTGAGSALFAVSTAVGSTIQPLRVVSNVFGTNTGIGLIVDPSGNIIAVNGAIFIGPVQIPTLINVPVLGTDGFGNIIAGAVSGLGGIQSINSDFTAAQQIVGVAPISVVTSVGTGITTISLTSALAQLTLNPTTITGGSNSTGTVRLTQPAPPAGAVVTLSSNNPLATVPANVTVAAGATTATFLISSSGVTAITTVSISGTYGVTQSANLTLDPPPVVNRIYGGVGQPNATNIVTLSGTTVVLSTGDVLQTIKTTAEVSGDIFGPFTTATQCIYLLLVGLNHTSFSDPASGLSIPFLTPPLLCTVGTGGPTMGLYQTKYTYVQTNQVRVVT